MRKTFGRRGIAALLLVAMLLTMVPAVSAAAPNMGSFDLSGIDQYVVAQTDYTVVPGVTESHISLNNQAGNAQTMAYVTVVEPDAEVEFKASYSGYYSLGSTPESRKEVIDEQALTFDMRSTTKQAADFEAATGRNVVWATNGDYYNMQSGQPLGYLIMEGNVFQTHGYMYGQGNTCEPYFAVLKDGSYDIRNYGEDHSDVVEAVSGPFMLVIDGVARADLANDGTLAPRNSIGLREDGSVVLLLGDGRQGVSAGMTLHDQAVIMQNLGCVEALYLDGGGSATLASKHEGSDTLEIQNVPADGMERVVASTLLMVSTAEGDGKFDHASLTPNNEVYMAGSQVEFLANGVDSAGYPTDMPADVTWTLADSKFGTIDARTGIFTSNGTCGTVTVKLMQGSKEVGSTSIQVAEPEILAFASKSINLPFKATSDLDLQVKAGGRDINLGSVVLDWKIESKTENVEPSGIGSFTGNLFTTVKAKQTLNANITVSYTKGDGTVMTDTIAVEVGKMPQIIYDFEDYTPGHGVAEHDWGKYGKTYMPTTNPLTFLAWDDTANAPTMVTKEGPFTFDGSYIEFEPEQNDKCYFPASTIFAADGYPFMTSHTGVMQEGSASGDIVTAETGEVRFGEQALRWDYDYRVLNDGYKNVNMWLYSTERYELEGTPTGLGMWVYAPEETDNFWLWLRIWYYDHNGNQTSAWVHFKTQEGRSIQYNGIYWDGWMYVEADISHLAEYVTPDRPIHIGGENYWLNLTFIPGGSSNENGDKIPMGSFTKGCIYIDNVRAVYGDNVDDMEMPVFAGTTANGAALDNTVTEVTSNTVKLGATFSDPESDNSTGIDTAKTTLYVDGLKQELATSTETEAATADLTLANGQHSVRWSICDGFGNVTTITRYINVNAAETTLGSVSLKGADTAEIGKAFDLTLEATGYDKITAYSATIPLTNTFGDPTVTFGEGYTGTSSYDADKQILTISATAATPAAGTVATIGFNVPVNLSAADNLAYSITTGSFTQDGKDYSFAQANKNVATTAAYAVSADIMTVGGNGKIRVTTAAGTAAAKVNVYEVVAGQEDRLVGTTNSVGTLVTNDFCKIVGQEFTIYAMGDAGRSYYYTDTTSGLGSNEVAPTNIRLNAVEKSATTASISWFSSNQYTDDSAIVEYVRKDAYDPAKPTFRAVEGTSETHVFADDNAASQINTVQLTGLTPGTTYAYRVGDGINGHWSDVKYFTTTVEKADTTFFVIGDAQLAETGAEEDIAALQQVGKAVTDGNAVFGIQTGDFIDDAGNLAQWNQIQGIFSGSFDMPTIQVMGNHEYYGDIPGSHAEAIFDLPGENYYSVEYGNVYVAVINCNANLDEAAKWLVEDAATTDCEWKVVTLHQPPYYTNPKGSSAAYNEKLPAAMDAANIDMVFSGHDHAYARTHPMTGGQVDENGTVYFVCGDLGEKSRSSEYYPENNPDFHFATITQNYDAVYMMVETVGRDLTVTAYDLDGTVLDTYKMHHEINCEKDGHKAVYDSNALTCTTCGQTLTNYTGWATDKASGKDMYFLGGSMKTGWFVVNTDIYHFGSNGLAHKVTVVEDIPTNCDTTGHKLVKCECGETYELGYGRPTGHTYVANTNQDGSVIYICSTCGLKSDLAIPFVDVEPGKWYTKAVEFCYENDYIRGVTTVKFAPEMKLTRSQLATILWRMDGAPEPTIAYPFKDSVQNFATKAVVWAAENEIVTGYPDGTFRGANNMTRQELVTMFYRFAKYRGMDVSAAADLEKTFTDAKDINNFAKEPVAWSVAEELINGFENKTNHTFTFQPKGTATRAQTAQIIMKYMINVEGME